MTTALWHGYLDESGGAGMAAPGESYLLVAAIVVARPRVLDTIIRRARERFPFASHQEELKAAHSVDRLTRWVLAAVEREEVSIVVVATGKPTIRGGKGDPEVMYRRAVTRAVGICLERWPRLVMTLDKRYTQQYLREKLEVAIREGAAGTPESVLVIRQEDSRRSKGLQVVDFVAWAIAQKYQRGDYLLRPDQKPGARGGRSEGQIGWRVRLVPDFNLPGAHLSRPSPLAHSSAAYAVM